MTPQKQDSSTLQEDRATSDLGKKWLARIEEASKADLSEEAPKRLDYDDFDCSFDSRYEGNFNRELTCKPKKTDLDKYTANMLYVDLLAALRSMGRKGWREKLLTHQFDYFAYVLVNDHALENPSREDVVRSIFLNGYDAQSGRAAVEIRFNLIRRDAAIGYGKSPSQPTALGRTLGLGLKEMTRRNAKLESFRILGVEPNTKYGREINQYNISWVFPVEGKDRSKDVFENLTEALASMMPEE